MNAAKPDCSAGEAEQATLRECHVQALTAKGHVFKAQDAADALPDNTLRKHARLLLWRARGALEDLDNLLLAGGSK